MKIFIGYQNINSGAKVATEHILASLRKIAPRSEFIVYNQHPYRYAGTLAFTRNFLWSIWNFKWKLDKIDGELSAIYSPYYLVYLAKILSKQRHVPFYFHLHGDQAITELSQSPPNLMSLRYLYTSAINHVITFLQKFALRHAHKVFFVSQQARENFLDQHRVALAKNKTAIVANGIALNSFFPVSKKNKLLMKKKLVRNTKALIFLYVGRIDHKKGVLELIESLNLIKTNQQLILIIIHPDIPDKYSQKYLNELKTAAAKSKARIIFKKNPPELVNYYQIADLVVLPSYQEMMPLAMLEAFACGVPFMGSKAGNMPEILRQINEQLLLKAITPNHIAKKIEWFLKLKTTERQKIIAAEKKLAKKFSWKSSAKQIIAQLAEHQQSSHPR